ncbi:helix-turn-helix transcriptional regulator [Achromobacter spanius]|uniref:HTH luxR-type domain-containing protein n=1 Tax=Achromobacter spanius TaxID=217203 RepID=A0A2S0I6D5_9BURK|nr:hypothetical protein CLM73_09620 [Achromobacter spanius]
MAARGLPSLNKGRKQMPQFYERLSHLLIGARDVTPPSEIFEQVSNFAREIGYNFICYKRKRPYPLGRGRYVVFDNFPESVKHVISGRLERWPETCVEIVTWKETADPPHSDFLGTCVAGFTVSVIENAGVHASFTGLTTATEADPASSIDRIVLLAHISHALLSVAVEKSETTRVQNLSEREREVLRWTGDGMTAADIAEILSLSENTVNFHLKGVKAKLSSKTKTSAVVQAALLGLLR